MRKLMLAGVMTLAAGAAACSKPAQNAATTPGGGKAEDVAASPASPASAVTQALQPKRKEGLWRMAISSTGGPGVTMNAEMCVDAATASDFNVQRGSGSKDCANSKISPTGDGWAFQSVCKMQGMTMTTKGKVSGDMSSDYAMEAATHMDPAPQGMSADTQTRVHAKWLGPCPAGMKPGSVRMSGVNLGG
jgi:hypothetical protein